MAKQPETQRCSQCGGETAKGMLKSGNQDASIVIAGKADDFLGVVPYTTSPVTVRVCTDCGHIALYARNLQDLLRLEEPADRSEGLL